MEPEMTVMAPLALNMNVVPRTPAMPLGVLIVYCEIYLDHILIFREKN